VYLKICLTLVPFRDFFYKLLLKVALLFVMVLSLAYCLEGACYLVSFGFQIFCIIFLDQFFKNELSSIISFCVFLSQSSLK
jgi:hypothetical protein